MNIYNLMLSIIFLFIALTQGCQTNNDEISNIFGNEIKYELSKLDSSYRMFLQNNYDDDLELFLKDISNNGFDQIDDYKFDETDSLIYERYSNFNLSQLYLKYNYEEGSWRYDSTTSYYTAIKKEAYRGDDTALGYIGRVRQIGGLGISSLSYGLLDKLRKGNDEQNIYFISMLEIYYLVLNKRFEKRKRRIRHTDYIIETYNQAIKLSLDENSVNFVSGTEMSKSKINVLKNIDFCPKLFTFKDSIDINVFQDYTSKFSEFEELKETPFRTFLELTKIKSYKKPDATLMFSRICDGFLSAYLTNGDGEQPQHEVEVLFLIDSSGIVKTYKKQTIYEVY